MRKHFNHLNNQRGVSMVEYIMGAAIGVLILGVSIVVFTNQQSLIKDQNDSANIRAKGRLAIKALSKEIRMAGYGLPPNQGIQDSLSTTAITFRSNLDNVNTTLTPPPTGTGGEINDPSLDVLSSTGFSSGDNIVIYQPDFNTTELNGVASTGTELITLTSALANDFEFGLNAKLILVNKYNSVVIQYAGTQITKTVDGGSSTILVSDVESTNGLAFNFYGATVASQVDKIGITLNLVDTDNSDAVIEFKTDLSIRNS
jgi:Tfp pilus assembly protein PilW